VENVAHALAGALLAESAIRWRARSGDEPSERASRWLVFGSVVANNLPDADVLYAYAAGGKLGYLLHHRGHTHTLLAGAALGLALGAALLALARWRKAGLDRADHRWLLALCAVGPLVHVAMDGWNVYGVHPLWPAYDGWLYGDSVFIFEPLLWAAAMPPLLFATRSRAWRVVLGALLVLVCVLPWLAPEYVPLPFRIALPVVIALLLAVSWRASPGWRAVLGVASLVLVVLGFFTLSHLVRARLEARLAQDFPAEHTDDLALSPAPANALCWSAVAVQLDGGDIVVRRLTVASLPELVPASECPSPNERTTASLAEVIAQNDAEVVYRGEARVEAAFLSRLAARSCEARAMLQFARAPFVVDRGETIVLGDLRFDRDEELDFAEIEIDPERPQCPSFGAPWLAPLQSALP
jgi:inner membrane protein